MRLDPQAKPAAPTLDEPTAVAIALVCLALLLSGAVLAGIDLPLRAGDRSAFIILAAAGFAPGLVGMSASFSALGWRHPVNILASALAGMALVLIVVELTGQRLALALDDRGALSALFTLVLVKWLLSGWHLLRRA